MDTGRDFDTATAGRDQQRREATAAAGTLRQGEEDQARDNRQDSWEEPVGLGPASCIISTVNSYTAFLGSTRPALMYKADVTLCELVMTS